MRIYDIGLSALQAQQQNLAVLGNNLANASTPGYHRQRVELATRTPYDAGNLNFGSGVDVVHVTRLRNVSVEKALIRNSSELSEAQQTQEIGKQIESMLTPGNSTIHDTISSFFNRLEQVSNAPQDMTVRQEFIATATELTDAFNQLDGQLTALEQDVRLALDDNVKYMNQLAGDIARLNTLIFQARGNGGEPNDLLDRRDQLLGELSTLTEVDSQTQESGREFVLVAGGAAVIGSRTSTFKATDFSDGSTGITINELKTPVYTGAGKLNSLVTALNETIPEFRNRLGELSRQIIRAVDQQHAEGMPSKGPFNVLIGARSVRDVDVPLNRAGTEFPVQAGDLYLTVTEDATGLRRTSKLSIDPTTDSLTDIASMFDAVSGVSASVDPVRRTLVISASGPYSVDFAGRPDNQPDLSSMTGTSVPAFSGVYSGKNSEWDVSFSSAGEIGVTDGLTATIRDSSGQVVGIQNVGKGYEAGKSFEVANGVSLKLGSGSVNATDTFSAYMVGEPDETGLLSAVGLNSLFQGSVPGTYSVRSDLRSNPERLATTTSGLPGESLNFARIASLRDVRVHELGGRTFVEEISDVSASAGLIVQSSGKQSTQLEAYQTRLQTDRDSISGVDMNQEMLEMMQGQRAFQAAAKYLQTADQMLDELFSLVR